MDGTIENGTIFVTGATGYIGGRLVPRLLDAGYQVRCLARDPRKLSDRSWASHPDVEIVGGDAGDEEGLARALKGCRAAYYLIHSMIAAGSAYREEDNRLALAFARAAEKAKVERIVYLGGLGETGGDLSEHLASRREVERALDSGGVPVTVLRAAMIIGSGSASFEILRYLTERLPVMITPKWVDTLVQPIGVADALYYLVASLRTPETAGRTLDIGGPSIQNYRELMQMMAKVLGLRRRLIVPVPVLTPRLSSLWIHLVTPVGQRIARPLAMGLKNRVICRNDDARQLMRHRLLTAEEAIRAAVGKTRGGDVETTWMDAGPLPGDPDWAGGKTFEDRRQVEVRAPAEELYRSVCRVGGKQGWYAADPLWKLRGFLDRLAGGPGLGRGRRHEERLSYGDVLDFWRVTGIDPGKYLALRAEMKLPGAALLEFEISPDPHSPGRSRLVQTAKFKPKGLAGLLYWFAVLPVHGIVFRGMLNGIRRSAEADEQGSWIVSKFKFTSEIELPRPLDEVFSFFGDAGNLQILTPPWLRFKIVTPGPIEMGVGTRIDYRIGLHGLPLSWTSEITAWDPPRRFVDEQIRGPYRVWIHEHTFHEKDGGTVVRDHVCYAVPGGVLVNRLFVEPDLRKIFDYRHERLREIFA